MKTVLGDFNGKVGREDIFKPIIQNENLHEISDDKGGYNSEHCHIKRSNCQEYNVTTTFINKLGLLMGKHTTRLITS